MPRVDEKKTLSEVLGESVEGYRRIFDLAPIALGISDNEGHVLAVNRAHQKITGYSFEDWKNTSIATLYEDPNDRNRLLESVQEKGRVQEWEAKFKRKDGTEFIAIINMEQIEIAGRNVFFTALRDITDLKRAQQELRERDEAIRKLSMPVVEVAEGVILMPLVGILDSARARQLTESVLGHIAGGKVDVVVMDISGIAAIDTRTANYLLRTVQAVKLMGSDLVITGVRPDVAVTLVTLGVDLSSVVTRGSLRDGLQYAYDSVGLKLIKGSRT
jgi:rsbT co-antagonist protein RsbR